MQLMSLKFAAMALLLSATAAMAEGAAGTAPSAAGRAAPSEFGQARPDVDAQASAAPLTREVGDNEIQVGRYTTEITLRTAAASDPLRVVAIVHFPREVVRTVGDAVKYLLVRTGYELVDERSLDPHVQRLFSLRLPDSQRVLGPTHVADMLGTLMGPAFVLDADATNRTVGYRLGSAAPAVPGAPGAAGPTAAAAHPIDATVATAMTPSR